MQIDWITTIAQIINFLVLVYLLKRFLYQPIVATIDRRESHIAQRLEEASVQSATAEQKTIAYDEKLRELEQQKEQFLEEAKSEANAQRAQLLDALREEIAATRSHWQAEVQSERQAFLLQTRQLVGEQVCEVARQALQELADNTLEQQMLTVFVKKLTELSNDDKTRLAQTAKDKGLIVQTHFPLTPERQAMVTQQIHEQIVPDLSVDYVVVPELICGVALRGPGYKLEWNLDNYLTQIAEQLDDHLNLEHSQN